MRKGGAVAQDDFGRKHLALGAFQPSGADFVAQGSQFIFGDAEVGPHRVERRDRGQQIVLRTQIGAFFLLCRGGHPPQRRLDGGVREVELCGLDAGGGLLERCLGGLLLAGRIVEVFLRQRIELDQWLDALQIGKRSVVCRFGARLSGPGAIELHDEGLLVHLEQDLPGLDHRPFCIALFVKKAADPRNDADLLGALRQRHKFGDHRRIANLHPGHGHFRRWWRWRWRCRLLFAACGPEQQRQA